MTNSEPQSFGLFLVVFVTIEAVKSVDPEPLTALGYFSAIGLIVTIGVCLFHFLIERFRKKDRAYFWQSFRRSTVEVTVDGEPAYLVYPDRKAFAEAKKRYSGGDVPLFETKAGA